MSVPAADELSEWAFVFVMGGGAGLERQALVRALADAANLLNAIDAMHQPQAESVIAADCYNDNCDHDECPEIDMIVCSACFEISAEMNDEWVPDSVAWPCSTARLLHPEAGGS